MARETVFVSGVSKSDDEFHGREYTEKAGFEKRGAEKDFGILFRIERVRSGKSVGRTSFPRFDPRKEGSRYRVSGFGAFAEFPGCRSEIGVPVRGKPPLEASGVFSRFGRRFGLGTEKFEYAFGILFSLNENLVDFAKRVRRRSFLRGPFAHEDAGAVLSREPFEPGREIHPVAHDGEIRETFVAHVADEGFPGRDSDAESESRLGIRRRRRDHRKRGVASRRGVSGIWYRRTPIGHHRVSNVLVDGSTG